MNKEVHNLEFQIDQIMGTRRWKVATLLAQVYYLLRKCLMWEVKGERIDGFDPYEYIKPLKEIVVTEDDYTGVLVGTVPEFSMAVTIYNEDKDIVSFLSSVENQSLIPNEIVIVDGGSTDDTIRIVQKYQKTSKLNIVFILGNRLNIPSGRNLAIHNCRNEIIVLADGGTRLDKDYCNNLIGTFMRCPDAELVGGIYLPFKKTIYSSKFVPDWKQIDWRIFLPSTRSMLLKKSLAVQAGLYPEYLQTGDDTLFDVNYRRLSHRWVFNPNAVVYWDCPSSKIASDRLRDSYGYGQGRNGLGDFTYYSIDSGKLSDPFYAGYMRGREERALLEVEARGVLGLVIIYGELPLHDKAELVNLYLVRSLIARKYKVIYVNKCFRVHPDSYKTYLDLDLTMIEFYNYPHFDEYKTLLRYGMISRHIYVFSPGSYNRILLGEIRVKNIVELVIKILGNRSALKNYYRPAVDCQIPGLALIYERYLGCKPDGYFVEIGAYDGSSISNTAFLADMGWEGIYVEPIPEYAKMCQKRHENNRVSTLQVAVGNRKTKIRVNIGGDISTTLKNPKEFYASIGFPDEAKKHTGRSVVVDQLKLEEILKNGGVPSGFDLLVLDTEGTEWEILKSFNILNWRPKMVIVEMHENNIDWNKSELIKSSNVLINEYFRQAKYQKIYSDDINTIFVN